LSVDKIDPEGARRRIEEGIVILMTRMMKVQKRTTAQRFQRRLEEITQKLETTVGQIPKL
jgi:hypothetical protein